MRVNALGVFMGTQEFGKQMILQGTGGKIINTSSIAGRQGYAYVAVYCASKAAVISLTQSRRTRIRKAPDHGQCDRSRGRSDAPLGRA